MKASHTDQLELLELQKLDQKESALRHKRDSHPAHATVREFAGRVADLQRAARPFEVISPYSPSGDQPAAIAALTQRLEAGEKDVVREKDGWF